MTHDRELERYGAGHFFLATPGDQNYDLWLLRFDDTDQRDMIFGGADYGEGEAQRLAWEAWNLYAPTWSCRLFRTATLSPTLGVTEAMVEAGAREDEIVAALYRRFKEWSRRGFGPDDVTWCEVKAEVLQLISLVSAPPAQARAMALEEAAKVAEAFEAQENNAAWDKRHQGRDDNFNCARASAASHIAKAIRALTLPDAKQEEGR